MEAGFRCGTSQLKSGRDFRSARQAYTHAQKKLQKKQTSAPIPKKYLEYEVSQSGVVRGSTLIETTHPGQAP